jgi:hypothetical protein
MSNTNQEVLNVAPKIVESKQRAPYVFLSHDTRDADLAEAFSKLLSSVTAGVLKCFRSSDKKGVQGIEYGIEWFPELMKKLQEASDVVCILTENSINRPWILFEAGVAKGKLDTPILGLAIEVPLKTANTGPFAQFQNSDDEEDSLVKLVMQLVRKIPGAEPDESVVRMQVQSFKAKCSELLKRKPEKPKESKKDADESATVAKLFEEIKVMFNDLPTRLDASQIPARRRRMRRFPMEEMMHLSRRSTPDGGFLFALSFFRDEMPFLYDLGHDLIQIARTGTESETKEALFGFHETLEMILRTPMGRELFMDHPSTEEFVHRLHNFAEDAVQHARKKKKSG